MKPDFKEGIEKLDKKATKKRKQVDKAFIKMESKFKKSIEDDEKSQKAIQTLSAFKVSVFNTVNSYSEQMLDENSIVYEYSVEKQQIIDIQDKHTKILNEALSGYTDLHFILVDVTTEKEWKKLKSKLNCLFNFRQVICDISDANDKNKYFMVLWNPVLPELGYSPILKK